MWVAVKVRTDGPSTPMRSRPGSSTVTSVVAVDTRSHPAVIDACRATGLPLRSILFKHMLPNGVTPVLVESSFAIAAAILAEATLSYLGLGLPDPFRNLGLCHNRYARGRHHQR